MASERRSLQDRIRARQQSTFIGRQGQVIQFQENFAFSLDDDRRRFLFNIHGDAGVGKTFLTRQLRQSASTAGALTAYVDETAEDVTSAMSAIAEQFGRAGRKFGDFEKRAAEYQKRRHELESDPAAPVGVAAFLTKTAVTIGLAAARDIPVAGSILAPVDTAAAADQANQAREYLARKFSDHRDARLLLSPADELTPVFLNDLNNAATGRTVALFFDTYEITGLALDRWLRSLLRGRYGDLPETVVTTISGQKPLDPNMWGEYLPVIADIPLEPFSEAEARQFLSSKGISDESTVQVILTLSGRLPLWLATLADARSQGSADLGDPSGEAVERFLKWEDNPVRRETAIAAALPRLLNQDILAAISSNDAARELFAWLRGLPFVKRRGESWVYHDVVRDAMLRWRRAEAPTEWRAEHNKLAQAHAHWAVEATEGTDDTWNNGSWIDCKREETYHLLCAAPDGNLPAALASAVKAAERSTVRARQWAALITDAGHDADNNSLKEWGKRLTEGIDGENLAPYLTHLINDGNLDERHLVIAIEERGDAYQLLSRYDDAVSDYGRAIKLSPDRSWTISRRASAYHYMGRYEDSLADYNRVIELTEDPEHYMLHRGDIYRHLGQYENSLADYNHAIDHDPEYRWAFTGRALTYHDMGRYDDALADYNRAIELDPEMASSFSGRGDIYRHLGQYENSLADYNHAIELDPGDAENLSGRGEIYRRLERYGDALRDFNSAIELFTSQGVPLSEIFGDDNEVPPSQSHQFNYVSMAATLITSGRREEARAIFETAVKIRQNDGNMVNNHAFCLMPDNPEKALELLEKASQFKQVNNLVLEANRLRCLLELNRQAAALAIASVIVDSLKLLPKSSAHLWSIDGFNLEYIPDVRAYIVDLVEMIVRLSSDEQLSQRWAPVLADARAALK